MTRPAVSVVMPFGGPPWEAAPAVEALLSVDSSAADELVLVDNSGTLSADQAAALGFAYLTEGPSGPERAAVDCGPRMLIVSAPGERSPAYARNVGAEHASREWILFLDADCLPLGRLLEAYFAAEIAPEVGALVGEIVPAHGRRSLISQYGAARNFLSQRAHLQHPYLPRAVAANLLVRRAALDQVGGFFEGVRAAEDTDFSWRLQRAGWRLELRGEATVEHRYRASLAELRRQWRGYAAGRAWLSRRYQDFEPQPGLMRALGRIGGRFSGGRMPAGGAQVSARRLTPSASRQRASFLALDALLALEELAGLALSNQPEVDRLRGGGGTGAGRLVLVADRFPRRDDPRVELATTLGQARVEAVARPEVPDLEAGRRLPISYLEDAGTAVRVAAAAILLVQHPLRVARDVLSSRSGEPSTWMLAPAVRRLEREPQARLHPLGGEGAHALARRLARLAGRPLES